MSFTSVLRTEWLCNWRHCPPQWSMQGCLKTTLSFLFRQLLFILSPSFPLQSHFPPQSRKKKNKKALLLPPWWTAQAFYATLFCFCLFLGVFLCQICNIHILRSTCKWSVFTKKGYGRSCHAFFFLCFFLNLPCCLWATCYFETARIANQSLV